MGKPDPRFLGGESAVLTDTADHARCERIRMALSEVGLDPARVICWPEGGCVVGMGMGTEGLPIEQVEALCDRAIGLSGEATS